MGDKRPEARYSSDSRQSGTHNSMDLGTFAQHCINGLTLGGMYALVALGYTMVYGIIELINFAHGEIFMIGAFIGLLAVGILLELGLTNPFLLLLLAFLISMPLTGLLGFTIESVPSSFRMKNLPSAII